MKKLILFIALIFNALLCFSATHVYYVYVPSDLKPCKYRFVCEDCGKTFTRDVYWSDQLKKMYHYGNNNAMEVYSHPSKLCKECTHERAVNYFLKTILILLVVILVPLVLAKIIKYYYKKYYYYYE